MWSLQHIQYATIRAIANTSLYIKSSSYLSPSTQPDLFKTYPTRPHLYACRIFFPKSHRESQSQNQSQNQSQKPKSLPLIIRAHGGEPVDLAEGFRAADGVLIVTDHPDYRAIDVSAALAGSRARFVFDSWRVLDADRVAACGVRYAALGFERPDPARVPPSGVVA